MMLSMTKQAQKALSELDAKQYRQVGSLIFGLLSNPQPHDSQPLKGAPRGERRVDAGEYRIIYAVTADHIEILVIGKRNDDQVYKIWERMK